MSDSASKILTAGNMPKLNGGQADMVALANVFQLLKTAQEIKAAGGNNAKINRFVDNEMYYFTKAFDVLGSKKEKYRQLQTEFPFTNEGITALADKLQAFHKDKVLEKQIIEAAGGAESDIVKGEVTGVWDKGASLTDL